MHNLEKIISISMKFKATETFRSRFKHEPTGTNGSSIVFLFALSINVSPIGTVCVWADITGIDSAIIETGSYGRDPIRDPPNHYVEPSMRA
jgi:hypothetical protein